MNLSNLDHKDIWVRAAKTFVQAFLGALSLSDLAGLNLSDGKQLALAAASTGVSAVWNYLLAASKKQTVVIPAAK